MNGPDNTSNFAYMGIIREGRFSRTNKSAIGPDAPSMRGFMWLYQMLSEGKLPDTVRARIYTPEIFRTMAFLLPDL